jgi:OPA family sugar phosphate sensor protein UhpC-like MFS transporter
MLMHREYRKRRFLVFWSLVFGYSFFYVCRLTFSVAKKPILDSGLLNAAEMGQIGSAFFFTYAIGKLVNGFLADRSHIGRFIATGLFVSAAITILFGSIKSFYILLLIWAINGWFQAMGSAPSGASIAQWFSNRERGTRYGIWSIAHSVGEAMAFAAIPIVVVALGWQWGFWTTGLVCLLVGLMLFKTLADRPQAYGLPSVADYMNDHPAAAAAQKVVSVRQAQWEVIKNPLVWLLGLSCAAMYVSRYGINSWGTVYLQESKGYSLAMAGFIIGASKIGETVGALVSGMVSDFLFKSRRNIVILLYGVVEVAGLIMLFAVPGTFAGAVDPSYANELQQGVMSPTLLASLREQGCALPESARLVAAQIDGKPGWYVQADSWLSSLRGMRIEQAGGRLNVFYRNNFLHLLGLTLYGFGLGGLLVFIGGLVALDICPKHASGAALGLVGMFGYLGASIQDWMSGALIEAGKITVDGQTTHDFNSAMWFWLGTAVLSVALYCPMWRVKASD